ncbi:MAG: FliM/FliN family flagellar motor switch protein [Pseudomonadota bacterium]
MSNLSPALMRFGAVSVRLSVELGRTDMPLRDVLSLEQGSVVDLNRQTDELLDITANGKVVAQGEVIAQSGKFALRIVNMVGEDPSASSSAPSMQLNPGPPSFVEPSSTATDTAPPQGKENVASESDQEPGA